MKNEPICLFHPAQSKQKEKVKQSNNSEIGNWRRERGGEKGGGSMEAQITKDPQQPERDVGRAEKKKFGV